jgi:hypothetical protein
MVYQYTIAVGGERDFQLCLLVLLETASTLMPGISGRMSQGDMIETRINRVKGYCNREGTGVRTLKELANAGMVRKGNGQNRR